MDKLNEIFDFIIEWEIATEDEIQLVTRDMEQMKESE